MKQIILLLTLVPSMALAQLSPTNNINENISKWSSDQITTVVGTTLLSGAVSTQVEKWTGSPFLGVLSGVVLGAGVGYAKDRFDQSWNTAIVNNNPFYNDTLAGGFGGVLGSYTLSINLESLFSGRSRGSKTISFRKFDRYNARKFRRGNRNILGFTKTKNR